MFEDDMTTSLLLIILNDIDHHDVDDQIVMITHSVIRNIAITLIKLLHHTFSTKNYLRYYVILHFQKICVLYALTFLY